MLSFIVLLTLISSVVFLFCLLNGDELAFSITQLYKVEAKGQLNTSGNNKE